MARISYVDPETIADPQIRRWLEAARRKGRPGPENQAIRAHQPDVMRSFTLTREMLFDNGAGVNYHIICDTDSSADDSADGNGNANAQSYGTGDCCCRMYRVDQVKPHIPEILKMDFADIIHTDCYNRSPGAGFQ